MKIIGFVGPKGAGKDEAARILKDAKKARGKFSFAGPLKKICSDVFSVPERLMHDPVLKEKEFDTPITLTSRVLRNLKRELPAWLSQTTEDGYNRYDAMTATINGVEHRVCKSPRELLQIVGTEFIREKVYKNWHLEAAFGERVMSDPNIRQNAVYCVTDIRFPNELDYLQERFGDDFICYYIERPEAEERLAEATHASELMVKELREKLGNNILKNKGSVEDFEKLVLKTIKISKDTTSKGAAEPKKASKFVYGTRNGQ